MLGEKLIDTDNIEAGGELRGMELLPGETVFKPQKRRTRVEGVFENVEGIFKKLSGKTFEGYEIHMGVTQNKGASNLSKIDDGKEEKLDGMCSNNIYGSYIHGIFDREGVASEIVRALMEKKGIENIKDTYIDMKKYKEEQYDKLADEMRKALDIEGIYALLGLK